MGRRIVVGLGLWAGCGGTVPPTAAIAPGTYAVTFEPVADSCKILQGPQFADVTVTPTAIEITGLGRKLNLAQRAGAWVADGNVDAECPNDAAYELFVLTPTANGGFAGSFESLFLLPDACQATCLVRAQVVGAPGATPTAKKVHGSFVGSSFQIVRSPLAMGMPPSATRGGAPLGLFGQPAPGDAIQPSIVAPPRGAAPIVPGMLGGPPMPPGGLMPPGAPMPPGGPMPPPPPGMAPPGVSPGPPGMPGMLPGGPGAAPR